MSPYQPDFWDDSLHEDLSQYFRDHFAVPSNSLFGLIEAPLSPIVKEDSIGRRSKEEPVRAGKAADEGVSGKAWVHRGQLQVVNLDGMRKARLHQHRKQLDATPITHVPHPLLEVPIIRVSHLVQAVPITRVSHPLRAVKI